MVPDGRDIKLIKASDVNALAVVKGGAFPRLAWIANTANTRNAENHAGRFPAMELERKNILIEITYPLHFASLYFGDIPFLPVSHDASPPG